MMTVKKWFCGIVLCVGGLCVAQASDFVVKSIAINGLASIQKSTVLHKIPVKVGQSFDDASSSALLKSLYKSGYFETVSLSKRGQQLIINVTERPVIGQLDVTGNDAISNKNLKPVLKKMNITVGEFYSPSQVAELSAGLKQQYAMLGHYAAKINASTKPLPGRRVALSIKIDEGPVAKVKSIKIVGASSFSQKKLLKNVKLAKSSLFSLITHSDRYSEYQLDQDTKSLQDFYLNHGYLKYHLVSKKVDISKDNKSVDITLTVEEGPVYHVSHVTLGKRLAEVKEIAPLVTIQQGGVFSREQVMKVRDAIGDYYADQGYALSKVAVVPTLKDQDATVALQFTADPGQHSYVRRIHFTGNDRTADYVLRQRMQQMEGALYSKKKIDDSKRKLALLPFFKNISVNAEPVSGHPDQVDLDYKVEEVKAGSAQVQVGYGDVDGFLYGASISEPNFMGTGKFVSLGFQKSSYWSQYNYTYNNPFYTADGVGRGFNLNYTHYTPSDVDLGSYSENQYGGSVNYSLPMSQNNALTLGYGYSRYEISDVTGNATLSPSISDFVSTNPSPYDQFMLNAGWSFDGRDKAVFPTKGLLTSLNVTVGPPVMSSTVPYYTAKYNAQWYIPLGKGFVVSPHTQLGYGAGMGSDDELPFFYNFYAGGIDSMPGFEANSLGPRYDYTTKVDGEITDTGTSYLGGNLEMIGGVNVIFPNPFSDNMRFAWIVDAGNVFQTHDIRTSEGDPAADDGTSGTITKDALSLKNLRVSTGLMVEWHTFLPLSFSLAVPVVDKPGDETAIFGFNMNTSI